MGFTVLVLCRAPFYICLDKVRIYFLVCLMELYCVFTIAVGTAGNLGPARAGAPFLGKKWGKNPRGRRVPPPEPPSLVGLCGGEAVPLTGYLACGPHIERPVTARPPAGRAGDVDRYPLGKGGEKPFRFPLFPPVNEPLLPPARAGGRAMRRWS